MSTTKVKTKEVLSALLKARPLYALLATLLTMLGGNPRGSHCGSPTGAYGVVDRVIT